jgi:hypothetical protein
VIVGNTFVKIYANNIGGLVHRQIFKANNKPLKLYEYEKATNLKSSAYRAHRNLDNHRITHHRKHLQSVVG